MVKRILGLLIVSIFAIGIIAACSSDTGSEGASDPGESGSGEDPRDALKDDTSEVTIQYWHSHDETQTAGLNYLIDAFHDEYPHITVEPVFQGGYGDAQQVLIAAVAANNVPALTSLEVTRVTTLADNMALEDLSYYVERDNFDLDDFYDGMLDTYNYEGTQYGLPFMVSMSAFIYNQDLLDEAGLTPPDTWDEMEEFSEAFTNHFPDKYAFVIPGWSSWYYDPWIENAGGSILTEDGQSGLDSDGTKYFFNKWLEWVDNGWTYIPYGSGASGDMRTMFMEGEIGMIQHTSSLIDWYYEQVQDFEFNVSFIPGHEQRITHIGGAGLAIMEKASDLEKEAAWKFMKFATSPENVIEWNALTGYTPTRHSAIESEAGQQWLAENAVYNSVFGLFDDVLPRLKHPGYSEFRSVYEEVAGVMALENDVNPSELLDKAAEDMNEILLDY